VDSFSGDAVFASVGARSRVVGVLKEGWKIVPTPGAADSRVGGCASLGRHLDGRGG